MSTAMNYLFEWANGEAWKTHILNTIIKNQDIKPQQLAEDVLELLLNPTPVDQMPESDFRPSSNAEEVLVITELKKPKNINALAHDVEFSMGKNLNVFYGENGSGKSSYVRIFRKLADHYYTSAKHLPIFPNVYAEPKPMHSPWQSIEITYTFGETQHCDIVDINSRHSAISKINVFDSDSVFPLINSDLSFSVLPKGFELFQQAATVLDTLRAELSTMISNQKLERDGLFSDSSFEIVREEILQILNQVRNGDDIKAYLDSNFPRSISLDESIAEIDLQIMELESVNPKDKIAILNTQKAKLEAIKQSIEDLGTKLTHANIDKVNELIQDFEQKVSEERKFNEAFQKTISFLDIVNEEWMAFIKAGKLYYDSVNKSTINENEPCIFCTQPLLPTSVDVINHYLKHVDNHSSRERELIDKEMLKYHISAQLIGVTESENALFDNEKLLERIRSVVQLVNRNIEFFNRCLTDKASVESTMALDVSDLVRDIVKEIDSLSDRLVNLMKNRDQISEIITSRKALKHTLQKSEKLHASVDEFLRWFRLNESITQRTTAQKKCSTNSLTQKQKEAFAAIVQSQYLDTFSQYAKELNVSNVEIKLTPQKGKTVRRKYVASEDYKVSDIMSEGEQKAIAMAEFATDLTLRNDCNPVLFDDPVTSLDYKRSELFANLIYQLSRERQVLVFTHNIMFYYFLYNACSKENNPNNKFFKVDEYDMMNKGIVSESFSGRLETLAQVTRNLKQQGQAINAKTCVGDVLEEALKKAYSEIRTWCELIVEEGFFKSVVRRYEPNIRFTTIQKIDGSFVAELPTVYELFERACRWMAGHSQPTETQHVRATRNAFNTDLVYINALFERYKQ